MKKITKIFKIGLVLLLPIFFISVGTYLNLSKDYKNTKILAVGEDDYLTVDGTCNCTSRSVVMCNCGSASASLDSLCSGTVKMVKYRCSFTKGFNSFVETTSGTLNDACKKTGNFGTLTTVYYRAYFTCENTYVITINRDGGSLGSSDFTRSYDDDIQNYIYTKKTTEKSITVKFPTTGTKTGYTFGGITTEPNCKGLIQGVNVSISSADKNKTFYACWYKDVTFNGNGGKLSVTSKKCDGNSCTIEFPTIKESKTDSEFIGWSLDSTCYEKNIKWGVSTKTDKIAQGITIYACWKPKTDTKPPVTPPKDIPPQQPTTTQINDYRWVKSASSSVSCGDYVHITTCKLINNKPSECDIDSINLVKLSNPLKLEYKYIAEANTNQPTCPTNKRFAAKGGATYYTKYDDSTKKFVGDSKTLPCNTEVTFSLPIVYSCIYGDTVSNTVNLSGLTAKQYCRGSYINNGVTEYIYVDRSKLTYSDQSAVCKVKTPDPVEEEKPGTSTPDPTPGTSTPDPTPSTSECQYNYEPKTQQTTTEAVSLPICYQYKNGKFTADTYNEQSVFTCAKGYRRTYFEDKDNTLNTCKNVKKTGGTQTCYRVFNYYCSSTARPIIQGSGSLATKDNMGSIKIKGNDSVTNTGLKGYIIDTGEKPVTRFSDWKPFENNAYEASEPRSVGTWFAWVMTNDYAISYSIMLRVHSDDLTTTAKSLELKNPDNDEKFDFSPIKDNDGTLSYSQGINTSNYVRLSNQLVNDSMIATGFDMFTTAYELTVSSNKIAIYATLTNNDSYYAEGYEPRTIDLDYGRNVALIKIVNSKGETRTYTFIINRTDNRESINELKSLTVSKGKLNFDPNVSDYTISVPKNTKSVTINGTLESGKAAFVTGYEPRKVELIDNITTAVIKTISEADIVRNYLLTFIKTGAEIIEDIASSTYLSSLSIPGTELEFDRETLSYSVAVDYETELVPVYVFAESDNATVEVTGNVGLKVGPNKIEILVTNGSQSKMYTVFVNRKEDGLGISTNTKLQTLTVKGYDLNFNEDVEDYTLKIKREKTLLLSATPQSDRSEVYMYGNNDLTTFSTIRVKVIAENGETGLYSVDIVKDPFNKDLEITIAIVGSIILLGGGIILIINKRQKKLREYIEE